MKNEEQVKVRPYGFWNWGTGIAIAIITGALAMLFLVFKSTQVNFDMVEKDYYTAELQFDKKKAAQQNTRSLSAPIDIAQEGNYVIIQFPKECIGHDMEGNLLLYRPSNQKMDIEVPLSLDKDGIVMIENSKLNSGKYILKGDWVMNDISYNVEESFFFKR